MFVQITELSPEKPAGERDWLVQAESPEDAYEKLVELLHQPDDDTIVLVMIGAVSDKDAADILESKNPEQFAFVCVNS